MIARDNFCIGTGNREVLPIETDSMPYFCRYVERNYFIGGRIPWHWHQAFEIDYIADGSITFITTDENRITVNRGEMIFINTNVIHRATVSRDIRLYAHLFDMHYLSGVHGSAMESRYFQPITGSRALMMYKITPNDLRSVQMTEYVLKVTELAEKEPFGYEFEIRTLLDRFWQLLFLATADLRKNDRPRNSSSEERLMKMLDYIHTHYPEQVTLGDIAGAAGVSERECTRIFRKTASYTPVEYLRHYRIQMAEQYLPESAAGVSEISEKCGFRDLSYFGRVFREETGKTPSAYRRDPS